MKTSTKGTSYMDLVIDIKEGDLDKFPYDMLGTLRNYVSGRVKDKYPKRKYKVEGKKDQKAEGVCVVRRFPDLKKKRTA